MQVVAGWGHSTIVSESGQVFMCGRNAQGQLGLGDPTTFPVNERGHAHQLTFRRVDSIVHKRVVQVACGGEHTVSAISHLPCDLVLNTV
jgi:alpha-tubulin suppressor-like RCC1 family protein